MPPRTPESYLFDMLEAARKIQRFTAGYDQERFKQDERTVSAVERRLMIIGEAAKQIDPSFRHQFPEIVLNRPQRKPLSRTESGILKVNKINPAIVTSTDQRFVVSKNEGGE